MRRWYLGAAVLGIYLAGASFAQDKKPADKPGDKPAAAPAKPQDKKADAGHAGGMDEQAMMEEMMKAGAPGENHKLLAKLVGEWTFVNKCTWDPTKPPTESNGTQTNKSIFGGRYITANVKGKMAMPGPDGKMTDMEFEGQGLHGYDNTKQKFVSTWIDNMSTGILLTEGTYDPSTKTFTYMGECEMMPGMKAKIREVIRVIDDNKHVFEWYETTGGEPERKTMEITYTRKGSA